MNRALQFIVCLILGVAYLGLAGCGDAEQRPNILILIADDLGWNDVGAYGNNEVYTPNIDQLARNGIRFDNAFLTTSSCSASRGSILTGRYPHSNGLTDLHGSLPEEAVTVAKLLGESGYFTGAYGKWHVGHPAKSQFDEVLEDKSDSGTTDWQSALSELPTDRPFFVWLASRDPHLPHTRGTEFRKHYDPNDLTLPAGFVEGEGVREELLKYYLEVSSFDADIGAVIQVLEHRNILDNTIVIVMSDNGRPFHRNKLTLYDDGIKTPFIVHWPNGIAQPFTYPGLFSAVDIAPTILALAGVPIPGEMQGRSFAGVIHDSAFPGRDYVFAERNRHGKPAHERAVRSQGFLYKENQHPAGGDCQHTSFRKSRAFKALLAAHREGRLDAQGQACFVLLRPKVELFEVSEEGTNWRNLADDPAYVTTRNEMARRLHEWRESTGDFDFEPAAAVESK